MQLNKEQFYRIAVYGWQSHVRGPHADRATLSSCLRAATDKLYEEVLRHEKRNMDATDDLSNPV